MNILNADIMGVSQGGMIAQCIAISNPEKVNKLVLAVTSSKTYDELDKIKCPTLIIGGKQDNIVGVNSSKEIVDRISNSELYLYEDYGHAVYEEAKDFNEKVLKYFKR